MDISEIEYIVIEIGVVIDSLEYLKERFEERLYDEYCFLLKQDEGKPCYYELRSNLYFLSKITKSFIELKNKFDEQIDLIYKNS